MDKQTLARWYEVQAWFICNELLRKHNNLMDVMAVVDGLASYGDYPAEPVKLIINEIITSRRYNPSEEETILLLYKANVSTRKIKELMKKSGKSLYKVIHADDEDHKAFYPRLIPQQTELLIKFLKTIKELGGSYVNTN